MCILTFGVNFDGCVKVLLSIIFICGVLFYFNVLQYFFFNTRCIKLLYFFYVSGKHYFSQERT